MIEGRIEAITQQRDVLAAQIRTALNQAAFGSKNGGPSDDQLKSLVDQAKTLLQQASMLGSAH